MDDNKTIEELRGHFGRLMSRCGSIMGAHELEIARGVLVLITAHERQKREREAIAAYLKLPPDALLEEIWVKIGNKQKLLEVRNGH